MSEMKKCNGCGEEKELNKENFYWRNDRKVWEAQCKICSKEQMKKYRQEHKDELKEYFKKHYQENKKEILKQNKKYRKEHKDDIKERNKKYNKTHKESIKKYNKQYNKKNKSEINEKKKKYDKKRRKNNPKYKLKRNISRSIHHMLKDKKAGKSILKYLPYTIEELKIHIEKQFEPWMTWDNWGIYNPKTYNKNPTWQLDHIKPHSYFHYEDMDCQEFRDCWALENLRPLSSKQNCTDGNRNR